MQKNSFKNYSSGKKGTIFLGRSPNLKNTASKIIVPEKRNYIIGSVPNVQKKSFQTYSSGKKRNYVFGKVPKPEKHSFQNFSSAKKGTISLEGNRT